MDDSWRYSSFFENKKRNSEPALKFEYTKDAFNFEIVDLNSKDFVI